MCGTPQRSRRMVTVSGACAPATKAPSTTTMSACRSSISTRLAHAPVGTPGCALTGARRPATRRRGVQEVAQRRDQSSRETTRAPMSGLYAELEPHACGMLEVAGGDLVYWQACGNASGKAALVLHGGPGSGCTPWHRRLFDPAEYRIVLFDQRNCGRSRPSASLPGTDLSRNTTDNLIADIESLRAHLGVGRWLVLG